jgi:hypothetical protein
MHLKIVFTLSAILAFVFVIPTNSQEIKVDETTGKYVTGNTISFQSLNKDTLFKKTYKWFFSKYPATGDKGTYIDASNNRIVAHQFFIPDPEGLWDLTNLRIGFILTMDCKDRKLRYNFTDFYYHSLGDGKVPFESQKFQSYDVTMRNVMLKATNEYVKKLVNELTTFLQKADTGKQSGK